MYYCEAHQVAFETPRQWSGHCLHDHPGESRMKAEEASVDEVPEGTRIVPAPTHRPVSERVSPPPSNPAGERHVPLNEQPFSDYRSPYLEEDEAHLDELLDSIGILQVQRQTIVKGWRNLPVLHQHPANLENYIVNIVGPKFRQSVPLVVHAMFPGAEPEAPPPQYMYEQPRYGRQAPVFWDGRRPPIYARDWEPEPPSYDYRYYRQGPPGPGNAAASPEVVELQKKFDGILEVLQAERAERAKEKQERDAKERDAALRAEINAIAGKVESSFQDISGVVKTLADQIKQGYTESETSRTQQLAEKVETLTHTLADQREANLLTSVEGLHKELAEVRSKVNAEPTGKTTEDLLSQGIPLALAEVRTMSAAGMAELKAIREQAADGKLPSLTPPTPPGVGKAGDSANPVRTAQQIAGARAVEDHILSLTGAQQRQ